VAVCMAKAKGEGWYAPRRDPAIVRE
jgi:hypothetical protein